MDESSRQAMFIQAFKDPGSALYKNMMQILRDCSAEEERSKQVSPYVGLSFPVDAEVQSALELQFGVRIRTSSGQKRAPLTDRVAGLLALLDAAMLENAGGCGRQVLLVDGDLATIAACGIEGRVIERTHATARLATGYHLEDEQLVRSVSNRASKLNVRSDVLFRELRAGGGEHYWPFVREHGPKVDAIVVNHFRTPVGAAQMAFLGLRRGAVVFGCVPFQTDMLVKDKGPLECFPGMFYKDRVLDSLTLVPEQDATQSVSIPLSAWEEILLNNSVVVDDMEFLCEKYMSVKGVMYYTLNSVDAEFEAPERLVTNYFDKSKLRVTEISCPKVKYSSEGVPIGWERGVVSVLSDRVEKTLNRLMCDSDSIVTPAAAFTALADHNNTVLNSLDTTQLALRMDVFDEMDAAVALALHVNWVRHASRKTFNTLLDAIKMRFAVRDEWLPRMAMVALLCWWNRPTVKGLASDCDIPVAEVVGWCGEDFTVRMSDADPWVEISQDVGVKKRRDARYYDWMPKPPPVRDGEWLKSILSRVKQAIAGGEVEKTVRTVVAGRVKKNDWLFGSSPGVAETSTAMVTVERDVSLARTENVLTSVKQALKGKLAKEQGAVWLDPIERHTVSRESAVGGEFRTPVAPVDPVSSIEQDLLMVNRGPFQTLGPTAGFRIADTDVVKNITGEFKINDMKRDIPHRKYVRLPKVDAGVEGVRAGSMMSLFGALCKRNLGIPSNRGVVNLDSIAGVAVDKMIQTCYRLDWQDVVERHLEAGMWQFNSADIENFLGNIDEKKVKTLMNGFFMESQVDLQDWLLMAKGAVKPSREPQTHTKVDHAQTILYLRETNVNAAYSAMIRRFKECMDECLRPEVCINPQRSDAEHEEWYNSLETHRASFRKTYSYGSDVRCFDRSQEHVARRIHMEFYSRHGLNKATLDKWESMYGVKRAVSMMYGIVLSLHLGGVSGVFDTIMRNAIVNWAAVVVSADLRRADVVMLDIKGDDMDLETSRAIEVETAVEGMSLAFNFSAKFFTNDVRYCCKQFRVKHAGRWYFLADPWARVQSLCKPIVMGNNEDLIEERFVSLGAELRHYDNGLLVDLAAECAQVFYGLEKPLYGMARGLAAVAADQKVFLNFFCPVTKLS